MSDNKMKLQAPIEFEMKVHITDGDGVNGFITVDVGKGRFPTEPEIRDALVVVEKTAKEQGFRLMEKHEWWSLICPNLEERDDSGEVISTPFAMPGGSDWDK